MSDQNLDATEATVPSETSESNVPSVPVETSEKQEDSVSVEVTKTTTDTPVSTATPQDSTGPEKPDTIEHNHPDGSVSAVSDHPPSTEQKEPPANENEAGVLKENVMKNDETAHSEHSDASVNSAVPSVVVSLATDTGHAPEHETTKVDSTEEHITEPIMHVVDPCTEVPEPVGTPKASRSKIIESPAADSSTELNVAQLVDAVIVREAVLEEMKNEQPQEEQEKTHQEDKENAEPSVCPKPEQEPDTRPKRPPPPVISSVAQGKAEKKHHGLHFRFGGSKSREGSLERHKFGSSMRNAIGTLTKSIKKKQQQLSHHQPADKEPQVASVEVRTSHTAPFHRPGERYQVAVKSPHDYHEEQSLQSVSGVSLSQEPSLEGTPNERRRHLFRSAAPDFINALPSEENLSEPQPIYVNHSMQPQYQSNEDKVLQWTAASIATTAMPGTCDAYDNAVHESPIHPVHVTRGQPQQKMLNRLVTHDLSVQSSRGGGGGGVSGSPKPPRPISRPVLSPLDYQAFHSEDSLSHPGMVTRRVELNVANPAPYPTNVQQTFELHAEPGKRNVYKTTASLDRREYDSINRTPQGDVKRAQTLRTTDYAGRLRERLRTIRGGSCEITDESGGTLRVTKPRSKPENYVCSETIHWPKKLLKLKRRQTTPPAKTVHPTPHESVIPRPQPRLAMSYYAGPNSPPGMSSPLQEDVLVSQRVMVQGKPPMPLPVQAAHLETPPRLTSLKTLAASVESQRCTALPDSPQRGIIQTMDANLGSPKPEQEVTEFPYLSDGIVAQLAQVDQGPSTDANATSITTAVLKIHPFLSAWNKTQENEVTNASAEDTADKTDQKPAVSTEQLRSSFQDYLNTCVRLRSVDLQGHFAPFHYPLRTFDASVWGKCARLVPWDNLTVIREPGTNTEYVQLPPSKGDSTSFIYPKRPIETLLTNWLDCHQTETSSGYNTDRSTAGSRSSSIFHPILLAVTLDQLLATCKENKVDELADTCFRLATLLSYESCSKSQTGSNEINHNLNDILVVMSTINCLVVFKKQTGAETDPNKGTAETENEESSNKPTDNQLVKSLCPEHETTGNAIDALIEKLNTIAKNVVSGTEWTPAVLLKAIAPPDWMATCVSRIFLKHQ